MKTSPDIFPLLLLISVAAFASCRRPAAEAAPADLSDTAVIEEPAAPDTMSRADSIGTTTEEILDYMEQSADSAAYSASILPDLARDVPEYAAKILESDASGFLIVDKNTMKIYRYDRQGVLQESVGMACSKQYGTKHKRRDNRTPEGFFTIEGKYDSTDWLYTDDDGNTSEQKGQFGPRFLRLKTPVSSQIGIHGTCAPWSIGGRRSHGCIRMTNENILRFYDIVEKGWPVIVSPGRKDLAVNAEEGYDIPTVPVIPGRPRLTLRHLPKPAEAESSMPAEADSTKAAEADSIPEADTIADTIPAQPM